MQSLVGIVVLVFLATLHPAMADDEAEDLWFCERKACETCRATATMLVCGLETCNWDLSTKLTGQIKHMWAIFHGDPGSDTGSL